MLNSSVAPAKPLSDAEYEAITDQLLRDMYAQNALMEKDRVQINCLKDETRQLREESLRLEKENKAILARLKAAW